MFNRFMAMLVFGSLAAFSAQASDTQPARTFLKKSVASVEFNSEPLEKVVQWLNSQTGGEVNIVVSWARLSGAGITRNTKVSTTIKNVSMKQVLNEIFEGLEYDVRLAYDANDNVLRISTKEHFMNEMLVRSYYVGDITFPIPDHQPGESSPADGRVDEDRNQKMNELRQLVLDLVEPTSWETKGGPGTLRSFDLSLLARNSVYVHQQLGEFLDTLR